MLAPVAIDGEVAGTIGVVGPTRMHYPRALAAVQLVGEQLGEHLGQPRRRASAAGPGAASDAGRARRRGEADRGD